MMLKPAKILLAAFFLVLFLSGNGFAEAPVVVEHAVPPPMGMEAAAHHADVSAHNESSGGLPQLDPSSFASQTFWLIVFFGFLYFFFSKKTLPQISDVIENRNARIQHDLNNAEELRQEAEGIQKAYEDSLNHARIKAADYFKKAEKSVQAKSAQQFQEFYDDSAAQLAKTEKQIAQAKQKAMDDMHDSVAEIASQAAEKIIGVRASLDQVKTVMKSIQKSAKAA